MDCGKSPSAKGDISPLKNQVDLNMMTFGGAQAKY